MHLTVDGNAMNEELMREQPKLTLWLVHTVDFIGMSRIDGPHVVKFQNYGWGLTGVIIIAESHISVHTFPEKPQVYIDVFSCSDFDYRLVEGMIIRDFKIKQPKVGLDKVRGTEWKSEVKL